MTIGELRARADHTIIAETRELVLVQRWHPLHPWVTWRVGPRGIHSGVYRAERAQAEADFLRRAGLAGAPRRAPWQS